jgi:hypothetical protein
MLVFRQCPLDISPIDCYLALDFFGFPALDIDIKIKEDHPSKIKHTTLFSIFLKTQRAIPLWIERVKTTVEETSSDVVSYALCPRGMGSKGAHFVLGPSFHTGSLYGPDDLLVHHYEVMLEPGLSLSYFPPHLPDLKSDFGFQVSNATGSKWGRRADNGITAKAQPINCSPR